MNKIDLAGRRAVVTGAAQGIGLAVTQRLLESGAAVSLWDKDAALLQQTRDQLSGQVDTQAVDVTAAAAVAAAAAATQQNLGGIDILVNNAGIAGPSIKTWDYDPADWQAVIDLDLTAVFLCCKTIAPLMMAQNYGRHRQCRIDRR